MEVDTQGNVLRSVVIGGSGDDRLYDITFDGSGHLVMAGWTTSSGSGNRDMWVIHLTDPNSWTIPCTNNTCNVASVTPTVATSITTALRTYSRTAISGIQPGGQSGSGSPTGTKCP